MEPPKELIEQIKRQEECSLTAYWDPVGQIYTIGIGHTPARIGQIITDPDAIRLLTLDLEQAQTELITAIPWAQSLDPVRYCVLWNMTFNEGVGHLLEFKLMLAACRVRNWPEAARQMAESLWARQVKERALELEAQMRTGTWQKENVA